jgi:putative aldouronate transport system permease protein
LDFYKDSIGDRIFNIVNYTFNFFILVIVLYPLIYILSASFSDPNAVLTGQVWLWPVSLSLEGYQAVFRYDLVWTGMVNSVIITIVGTMINVCMTVAAAYALSRSDLFGKNFLMFLFVFTLMFSGGLVPLYMLVRELDLLNSRWALLLPNAIIIWNLIIARTFFQVTIPKELLEASQMDGCSDIKFLMRVVLPLSLPIIAVLSLFYAVFHWNQYFHAFIFLRDKDLYTLQLVLREILVIDEVDQNMITNAEEQVRREGLRHQLKYSLIVISTFPILLVYPFVQKHFVKGVMIGSLKG